MDPQKLAEVEAVAAAAKAKAEAAGGTDEALNKELADAELAVTQAKAAPLQKTKSEQIEKAKRSLFFKAQEVKNLGGDPTEVIHEVLGTDFNVDPALSDDTPLTVGSLRAIQKSDAHKTALQMVETLPEDERDEVKAILATRIVPSGNPEADLRLARGAANSDRNAKIAEEAARRGNPRQQAAGGSGNVQREDEFVPTAEEQAFMAPPYRLSKTKILENRAKAKTPTA